MRTQRMPAIQRMVGINAADIHGEITGLIANPRDMAALTQAYTFLQHIDWAHKIVGGRVFDLGSPAFNAIGKSENLILVAHGAPGSSGGFSGAQLADRVAAGGTGVPGDWEGEVFITSCYSGVGVDSVVASMAARLGALGRGGIKVTGYTGTTITHAQFGRFLFVVNPAKEREMKAISEATTKKYQHLFGEWLGRMSGLKPDNILELAAYTSTLTRDAYDEIVTEASAQGLFLEPEDAEVTAAS